MDVNIINAVDEADTDTAEVSNLEMDSTAPHLRSDASGSFLLPEGGQFDLQVSYLNIPPDQTRTIHNINTLISEVGSVSSVDSSFLSQKSKKKIDFCKLLAAYNILIYLPMWYFSIYCLIG